MSWPPRESNPHQALRRSRSDGPLTLFSLYSKNDLVRIFLPLMKMMILKKNNLMQTVKGKIICYLQRALKLANQCSKWKTPIFQHWNQLYMSCRRKNKLRSITSGSWRDITKCYSTTSTRNIRPFKSNNIRIIFPVSRSNLCSNFQYRTKFGEIKEKVKLLTFVP